MSKLLWEGLTERIIGAAIEVHRELGPGLLESAYQRCLCYELTWAGIPFECQVEVPIRYKGELIDVKYRIDVLVDDKIVVELKAVEELLPLHEAQLLTYMKLRGARLGLLINFNTTVLIDGVRRRIL